MNKSNSRFTGTARTIGILSMVVALTAILYWPGLNGGFLFDDFPNIVDNDDVHLTNNDWPDWKHAASASPAHDLPRPLAMLSYAANYHFTGLDPWPMKFTNLLIHLVNGLLLYTVLRLLLGLWNQGRIHRLQETTVAWASAGLACAWLVCPINLSSVLYVVQRMESLAQTFVLCGLWLYLRGRQCTIYGGNGTVLTAGGLVFGTVFGLLCKESAALLPLYAFLVELTILGFCTPDLPARRRLWATYFILLLVPAVIGLTWLIPRTISAEAYAARPFSLPQRLLTESRVLVDYAVWTLFPRPDYLGFYHDDIAVSTGWLSPPATIGCAILITTILSASFWLRHKLPLFSLGIFWYFAAHLLTATIIPLELVFEHRNYFASIGLLLAVTALLLEIPEQLKLLRLALPLLALSIFCSVTALRANEWGNPIRFAYSEAYEHPSSGRANYELGRTLVIASGYRANSNLIDPAIDAFERASELPGSQASSLASLIIIASHMHKEVNTNWWQQMTESLRVHSVSVGDIGALRSLQDCQQKGYCAAAPAQLLSAFLAALNHPHPSATLLASYGTFAANELGDYALAESVLTDAVTVAPKVAAYKLDLAAVLILRGNLQTASAILDQLSAANLDRIDAERDAKLKHMINPAAPPS